MNKSQSFIENVVSHVVSSFKQIGSTAALVGVLAGSPAIQSCDTPDTKSVIELNDSQKEFADLLNPANPKLINAKLVQPSIIDGKPVVSIPLKPFLYVDPLLSPQEQEYLTMMNEVLPSFMSLELKSVDPKTMTYSVTPVVSKDAVAKLMKIAELQSPGKRLYIVACAGKILSSANKSLFPGFEISNVDDNNPRASAPSLVDLPERFALSTLNKSYGNGYMDSYDVTGGSALNFDISVGSIGSSYELNRINYTIAPIQTIKQSL